MVKDVGQSSSEKRKRLNVDACATPHFCFVCPTYEFQDNSLKIHIEFDLTNSVIELASFKAASPL